MKTKLHVSAICYSLFAIFLLLFSAPAATVTGTLNDISIQALNTKLTFAPTNEVLLTGTGLSVGPPKTISTTNGEFSIVLEAGNYTVSLPLIAWRKPFLISVFPTNAAVNITNLLSPPLTFTYTNAYATWLRNGDDIFYTGGNVGIGLDTPSTRLEAKADSLSDVPAQLSLSATNTDSAVGLRFKSPNSVADWQLSIAHDVFSVGKVGIGNLLELPADGACTAISFALSGGGTSLNADGSASFANGASAISTDGSASFVGGAVAMGANPLLHLQNNSSAADPEQLLIETTDIGAAGIQFKNPDSASNWQAYLSEDSFKIGKVDLGDFLTLNPAGRLNAPFGYAVGGSIGLSTNVSVIVPGPKTNVLVFTKGILTNVQ